MSGETEGDISGWTVDTLHAYILRMLAERDLRYQQRFDAQQAALVTVPPLAQQIGQLSTQVDGFVDLMEAKFVTFRTLIDSQGEKVALALASSDKAVNKAEIATEKRFDAVNEFRGQLTDQAATFARREYVDGQVSGLDRRLDDATEARIALLSEMRAIADRLLSKDVFDAALAASIADRDTLRDRIKVLESRVDLAAGAAQGSSTKVTDLRSTMIIGLSLLGLMLGVIVFIANIITRTR